MKSILSFGFSAVVTALLIIISCQKSNNDAPDDTSKPIEYVTAGISGRVLDDNNQPVNGAVVKAGTASTTTDINGSFKISNVSLDKNAGFIKIEKDGFFQGSRTIIVNEGVVNFISIQLIKRTVSGTVSGGTGGNISVQGGGSIVFTGNSFVNTAGNSAYTGTVSVSTFFLNPTASNFNEIMPGTLRGINAANEETGLQSFGMMAVELTGAGGEKLQLAPGKTATLTFPVPTALQAQAPATIPLWSFNETTGLWKEEGTATKQGTNYVGTVSHFSFWNCDYPYELIDFKALLKDNNGDAIYPAQVVITEIADSISSFGYGYTDTTGLITGKIPSGKSLKIKVYNNCKTIIYSQHIGPFPANADLGTISMNAAGATRMTLSGTVINCNAAAVTNGFVDIMVEGTQHKATVTNGSFNYTFNRCSSAPFTAVFQAYDLDKNQTGPATNITIASRTANAGQVSACGNTVNEFFNYTLDGTPVSYVLPADTFAWYSGTPPYPDVFEARRKANTKLYDDVWIRYEPTGVGTIIPQTFSIITPNSKTFVQRHNSKLNINITEFGAPGGYVGGNFSDSLIDSFTKKIVLPINGVFRVKRK